MLVVSQDIIERYINTYSIKFDFYTNHGRTFNLCIFRFIFQFFFNIAQLFKTN